LDKYAKKNSFLHNLDPRTKLISFFIFILLIILTPVNKDIHFLIFFALAMVLIFLSRVPISYYLKSVFTILPFIFLITIFIPFYKEGKVAGSYNLGFSRILITSSGLIVLKNVLIKSFLSILVFSIISATTEFHYLLKALEKLKLPKVFILILSFMYRYIFILFDEKLRIERAISSKYFGKKPILLYKTIGNVIGTLFIRNYERAERVYIAMCSKLFDGNIKTLTNLKFRVYDIYFLILFSFLLVCIKLFIK
jgi:cobalt/nickel transport system permease protein